MKKTNPAASQEKIENKIIDLIGSGSDGQLIVSVSPDSEAADFLVLEKRGEYYNEKIKYLQLVVCQKTEDNKFISPIFDKEEEVDKNLFFLFFYFDFISQDVFNYVWFVPAQIFFEISDSALNNDKVGYFFSAPTDVKAEDKFNRYLIEKKNLARTIVRVFKEGDDFMFSGSSLSGILHFKNEDLKKTIIDGRKHGFAGSGAPVDNPRLRGSTEYEYQKGDWAYQDIYFSGKDNFIGQEVVYYNLKPIWSMVYMGDNIFDEEETDFLKYALMYLSEKVRFGGQGEVNRKGLAYKDSGEGSFEKFFGQEVVTKRNGKICKINYRGGLILK